jgi:hypothetical protein
MLNVPAALRLIHTEGWRESRYTLGRCSDQIERAAHELELARDLVRLLTGPDLTLALVAEKALEHLDAARLRLVGTAAGCTPPKGSR